MFPYCRVPTHITALYIFTVINFLALFHVTIVQAEVDVVTQNMEQQVARIPDEPAQFGRRIDLDGIEGRLALAMPNNACSAVQEAPKTGTWFLLIRQSAGILGDNCTFVTKVTNAQNANYQAAIIYNYKNDVLKGMAGVGPDLIPSVFIGLHDGRKLQDEFIDPVRYKIKIWERFDNLNIMNYLIAFACIMGFIFVITVTTLIVRFIKDLQQRRRRQLSPQHLKTLPVKKFEKGDDQYETCAICLEDYVEGDKLRILPCAHAYHTKCIDPWLTKNKRTCPVCKRKVFPEGVVPDSDDESDEDERTPLLPQHGNRSMIGGNTFSTAAHLAPSPPPMPYFFDDDDTESDNWSEASGGPTQGSGGGATNVSSVLPPLASGSINANDEDVVIAVPQNRSHRRTENGLVQIGIDATTTTQPSTRPQEGGALASNRGNDMVI